MSSFHSNGTPMWSLGVAYHPNGQVAWSLGVAHHSNGQVAWNLGVAYWPNGQVAWSLGVGHHANGTSMGIVDSVELPLGEGMRLVCGKAGARLYVYGKQVV